MTSNMMMTNDKWWQQISALHDRMMKYAVRANIIKFTAGNMMFQVMQGSDQSWG